MKNIIKLTIVIVLLFSLLAIAQNQAPVVENVKFAQRTDDSFIVDIYYDVNDANNDTMFVTMLVSNNAGSTFNFAVTTINGDVGDSITSGTNKHIEWDFGKDHPDYSSDQIQIKILANDNGCGGYITDPRDGKTYNTVEIGDQCWFKENLNVGTKINSTTNGFQQTDNDTIEKYCYNNDEANCGAYGGLYEWTEAMQYVTTEGSQGICPSGWHIPTYSEMRTLETYVGDRATKLIDKNAKSGYSYTNETGFSALFAGTRLDNGNFDHLGYNTYFWSTTEDGSSASYRMRLGYDYSSVGLIGNGKYYGFSVRCLKD